MTAYITTYASGTAYLSALCTKLQSAGWGLVRDTASEKVFKLPNDMGFVAFIVSGDVCLVSGFPAFDDNKSASDQPDSYASSLPRFVLPAGSCNCITVVSSRRVAGVLIAGGIYYSFYAGLIESFGSSRQYPFPCFVGGSGSVDTLYKSAYPFYGGGPLYCPKVCCPDGSWQLVGGQDVVAYTSFDPAVNAAYIHPFNARFRSIGACLDGQVVLFPALVVSSFFNGSNSRPLDGVGTKYADDGQWLGYLEGVYVTTQGLPNGLTFAMEGITYVVVPNVNRSSEQYVLRLL